MCFCPLLLLCLLSAFSASAVGPAQPVLHPQPSSPLYHSPSSPHDTRHLYTHLPHGQVQLRSAFEPAAVDDAMVTVAVEASVPASWYDTIVSITGLPLSEAETAAAAAADGDEQPSNATAAAYILSMKAPSSVRHLQLLTDGIADTGYSARAYLPHNSFLVVPETANANETALVEWTLSSAHVHRSQRYVPHNKIDPLIGQPITPPQRVWHADQLVAMLTQLLSVVAVRVSDCQLSSWPGLKRLTFRWTTTLCKRAIASRITMARTEATMGLCGRWLCRSSLPATTKQQNSLSADGRIISLSAVKHSTHSLPTLPSLHCHCYHSLRIPRVLHVRRDWSIAGGVGSCHRRSVHRGVCYSAAVIYLFHRPVHRSLPLVTAGGRVDWHRRRV